MSYSVLFAYDLALEQIESAFSRMEELRSLYLSSFVTGALANVYMASGNLDKGQAILEQTGIPEKAMDGLGYRRCWVGWVDLALRRGEYKQALELVDRLIKSAPGWQPGRIIPYLEWLKSQALAALGLQNEALRSIEAAINGAKASGERYLIWRMFAGYGRLLAAAGEQQAAERGLAEARALVAELAASVSDRDLKQGFLQGAAEVMA